MSELVAVSAAPEQRALLEPVARATADLLGCRARAHEIDAQQGDLASVALACLEDDGVFGVVLARTPGSDRLLWDVLTRATKPVVVVPRGADRTGTVITNVLLPMDGSAETATAVAAITPRLVEGTVVTATHVLDPTTVPSFWDQAAHARDSWLPEFLVRHVPDGATLRVRRGQPPEQILAEAARCSADLILLAWKQRVGPGRARLVQRALSGTVPVMLVPAAGPSADGAGPSPVSTVGAAARPWKA